MVLSKKELMDKIKERIGDDTSDEALKFIEDFNDTYNDLEKKLNPNKKTDEEWQSELEAKDKEWREKYKARFFEGGTDDEEKNDEMLNPTTKKSTPEETITVDDLFNENGGK